MGTALLKFDKATLNKMAKEINKSTPIEDARKVALAYVDTCKFFKASKRNPEKNTKRSIDRLDAINAINGLSCPLELQKYLYNIMLKGEGLGVVKY